ncbi:MAG: DNA mismatch repair endonuclease MutL [Acidobacteriota bacterium]|jgi:DNA mismatch repair protein MutL|nr:MAG: DNA mismatch repair endonuclease MutL [Acidobacteriota bacterium]
MAVTRIRRLPPELANQIAAGEVVERPASVVKELVENALDAGARRVAVTMEFGGKKLIVVEDDGEGMTREDAELAIERHATSKIRSATDLAAIRTLGFRGEALPSIASVSRFRLRTRRRGDLSGTEIRVEAGAVTDVRECGAPEGTRVEVAELFFNLPARRKFLKADTAEAAQISRLVTQLALGYPEIGFVLRSGQRLLIEAPPAGSLEERFYQIYGDRPDLVVVRKEAAGISVRGFVAALAETGPVRGPQHVFVNGRIVRDRTITHAIQQAYSVATIKERSPEVHLFIELPADRVDVNVHPTKAEVRFLDQGLVHEVLRRAVIDALGATAAPELVLAPIAPSLTPSTSPLPLGFGRTGGGQDAAGLSSTTWRAGSPGATQGPAPTGAWPGAVSTGSGEGLPGEGLPAAATAANPSVADLIRPMVPLGQFRNTFIIAVDDEGIAIIDQHVAHERILFEQFSEKLTGEALESQRMLTPLVLELSAGEHQTLLGHREALVRFGFEIEDFGGTAVRVEAVPAILDLTRCDEVLRAVASDLDGLAPGAGIDEILRQMAATMACHAAVKANDPLTREKMQYLLDELRRTAHSSVCPHGRPVVLRLTRREIEKNFERI